MYELKRLGENWLLRRVGGQFARLFILKDAASVQISENCIIADDEVYEIVENNDEISLVKIPDFSTKCDRSQTKIIQPRKQKRIDYEYYTLPTSSIKKETDIRKLTNNNSDETESDFEDTEKKLEILNISPPKHETLLYLGSDELAVDQQSGSEALIEHIDSLEAGSDFVEEEGILKIVRSLLTDKNTASQLYSGDRNNKQQKKMGDVTSLQTSVSTIETKDVDVDTSMQAKVSADVDVSSDDAYSTLPSRSKTDTNKGGRLNGKYEVADNHTGNEYMYVVDVSPSGLALACGIKGLTICAIENSAIVFRNRGTFQVIYSFPITWIRNFQVFNKKLLRIEFGRKCKYEPGTIEISSRYALEIEHFITKIIMSPSL